MTLMTSGFPDKLLALEQSILEDPELDAICHDEKVRHHSGRENILHYGPTTPDFYRTLLIEGNRCSTSAMTVRRTFIELHAVQFNTDRDYVIVEDYDFWMRLAHHGARFRFLKAVLGEYVLGEGGISRNLERARHNWLRVLEDHVFRIQQFEPDREKLWRYLRARVYATNAISDLRLRRFVSFCRHMFSAVCLSPASVMDWTGARLRRKLRVID
ncbi:MAG: hypothetical protein IPG34_05355 [Rhodocyclaceae bacterium]|nr:hypothetical protein [Rhodocyclaceae bacterium]